MDEQSVEFIGLPTQTSIQLEGGSLVSAVLLPYLAREGEPRRAALETSCSSIYKQRASGSRVGRQQGGRSWAGGEKEDGRNALPCVRKQNK
jgi:hypothetical protein